MRSGIQHVITDGNGHYLGMAECICPKELLDQGESMATCPAHNYPEEQFAHDIRGIDTEAAVNERDRRRA